MKLIKYFLVFLLSIVFITFCVVNREWIVISLFPFPYSINIPVSAIILISVAAGAIVAGLMLNIQLFRMRHLVKNTRQRMQAVENENKALRSESDLALPALTKK